MLGQRESRIEILWTLTNSIRKKTKKEKKERREKKKKKKMAEHYHIAHVTNSQTMTIHNKLFCSALRLVFSTYSESHIQKFSVNMVMRSLTVM